MLTKSVINNKNRDAQIFSHQNNSFSDISVAALGMTFNMDVCIKGSTYLIGPMYFLTFGHKAETYPAQVFSSIPMHKSLWYKVSTLYSEN